MSNFSRLKLHVQAPLKLKDLTYKFVVTNNSTKKKTTFEGRFDEQGLTEWTQIFNLNTSLIYEVYFRGEILQKIAVKAYPNKKTHSVFTIKTTTELTKNVKENIKEIHLNNGEVAWYLIKKQETLMSWSQRVFKKPLTASDWDVLKANNPHLKNLVTIGVLEPGQVIILSNSTTAKDLTEYKIQAAQAHKKLEEMKKDWDFDAEFFAQNYEFFYDAIQNKNTKIVDKTIFEQDDHLAIKFNKNIEKKKEEGGFFESKMAVDATVTLAEGKAHRIYRIHAELAEKYAEEKAKGSALAASKNFKLFKQKYANLYSQIESESTQKFLKFDQSIKTSNMRRFLSQSAPSRDKNYKGGIKDYAKKMGEIGKFSKQLKLVGYVALASDVVSAGATVVEAKPEDRARTTVVETTKVAVGLGFGIVTSYLIIGVATGGAGLVVLGVVAASSVMAGKATSDTAGWVVGEVYDAVSEYQSK